MQTIISHSAEDAFARAQEGYKVLDGDMFDTGSVEVAQLEAVDYINWLSNICHEASAARGWWHSLTMSSGVTQEEPLGRQEYTLKERNVGELIALMHSELSEALEAARKDLVSDHIPEFSGVEEELADCLIRIFDFAGAANLQLGEAFVAKMKYNHTREDHSLEARAAVGGKKI